MTFKKWPSIENHYRSRADFLKDNPDVEDMDKSGQKLVYNVGSTIANMLKGYL